MNELNLENIKETKEELFKEVYYLRIIIATLCQGILCDDVDPVLVDNDLLIESINGKVDEWLPELEALDTENHLSHSELLNAAVALITESFAKDIEEVQKETDDSMSLDSKSVSELAEMANKGTDPKILDELSRRSEWEIKFGVACNNNTSAETLHYLAKDPTYDIRHMVASNENVGIDTLEFLVNDKDVVVAHEAKHMLEQRKSEG